MDSSDSDDGAGDYEPVTPDMTAEIPTVISQTPPVGGTGASKARQVHKYENWDTSMPAADQRPPRPDRTETDCIKLPQTVAKRTKKERIQQAFQRTLSKAWDGAKQATKVLKGAIKHAPKDKQGTSVSSPVDEDGPTPITEVEFSESSDDDSPRYDYPDASKLDFTFPPSTDDGIYPEADVNKNSLGRRKLSNTSHLPTKDTKICATVNPRTPKAYVKPMKPMEPDVTEDVVKPANAVQPAKDVLPVKAIQPGQDSPPSRLTSRRMPNLLTTDVAKKHAAPPITPKPVTTPTTEVITPTTKGKSVSREEMKNLTVEELFEWLKRLGIGEKVNTFVDRRVDGDLFLKIEEETFKAEYELTDTELLSVKRFQNQGKIPKSSYS